MPPKCAGQEGDNLVPCVFSTQDIGQAARVQPGRHGGGSRCLFCAGDVLNQRLATARGKGVITTALAFFQEHGPLDVLPQAVQRVKALAGEDAWTECATRLQHCLQKRGRTQQDRAERRQQNARNRAGGLATWAPVLEERRAQYSPSAQDVAAEKTAELAQQRALQRKFPAVYNPDVRDPSKWQTEMAATFRRFAQDWSWSSCQKCHRMVPQKFHPKHVRSAGRLRPQLKACAHCKSGVGYWSPRPSDVPEPLRQLPQSVLDALAILDVYTGPLERAPQGYLVHTGCVRFSWKPTSVEERLSGLPRPEWRLGRAAYEWLIAAEDCTYLDFLQAHDAFLRQRQRLLDQAELETSAPIPWLPLRFMETVGLECAVWPHLYWCRSMCETFVRSSDRRRLDRARRVAAADEEPDDFEAVDADGDAAMPAVVDDGSDLEEDSDEPIEDGDGPGGTETRQSAKASFMAKVFSSVIGYGSNRPLAQFVYDLWLWSSLGGARNAVPTTLRGALAGRSFSPLYWRNMHAGLVDCARQIGFPSLFITVAPLEMSAPYHCWLEDELKKACRARTHLPAAETFHLAHLLFQLAEGLLTGTNRQQQGRPARRWTRHVLAAEDPATATVVEMFGRLEFQDGKRKRHVGPSQSYHGSGRVHLHMLVWLQNADQVPWSRILRADIPSADDEPELHDLVRGSQLDWDTSAWPRHDGPTVYDKDAQLLRLHHPADAHAAHVRAFMPDVLEALQCHMDVQMGDGRGLLLQYTSTYAAKFSDQFASSWLNEEATDFQLARKVLTEYHPLEPEMWLQLGGQQFRQVLQTGVLRRVVLRPPWKGFPPSRWEQLYMTSAWRPDDCTLLEFLRLANESGERRKNRRRVLVAAAMDSAFHESFYGQWLLLHVPFRTFAELWDDRVLAVPEGYRMLALCLLKRPGFWRRLHDVRDELQLEGHRDAHICNVLSMVESRTAVIDAYLSGQLALDEDMPPADGFLDAPEVGYQGELDPEQAVVVEHIRTMVNLALERRYPEDPDGTAMQEYVRKLQTSRAQVARPFCVLGPAGSGKSTAVEVAIRRAVDAGAHVGIACPTGMLASSYRSKFPGLDVDTLHGMFLLHLPQEQTWDCMASFDVVVIDEIGQLSRYTLERLLWLWDNADRRPAIIFLGDFHQLRGMDSTRACDSPRWQPVVVRHLRTMRRCKCAELRWKLELLRTAKPNKDQLHRILRGHRAAPDRGPGVSPEPTELDVQYILEETPQTLFLTITRRNAALLNDLAVQALYSDALPLAVVPGDYESNLANYNQAGQLVDCEPVQVAIYEGMRVTLTRNLQKEQNFVNGMRCVVLGMQRGSVLVRTECGNVLSVFPFTDDEIDIDGEQHRATYFPLRLGYAVTLQKIQGATLEHITVWLDVPNVEAAAYVALSRVQYDNQWRFLGHATRHHFTPASGI
ncbi:Pif1 [Symbiodinium sp. CCMP2592]|nr:Pif1 [Symbiodinium sp. CCMP2592]